MEKEKQLNTSVLEIGLWNFEVINETRRKIYLIIKMTTLTADGSDPMYNL